MRISSDQALIITTATERPQISFVSRFTLPFFHHVEVLDLAPKPITLSFVNHDSLLSKDYFRFHIVVTFAVTVVRTEAEVGRIAETIGVQRANDPDSLKELFAPKLTELIQTQVLKQSRALLNKDASLLEQALVQEMHGWDNMGFHITLQSLNRCEEAELIYYDVDNILDIHGYKVLVEEEAERRVAENIRRIAAEKEQALQAIEQRQAL